MRVCRWSRRVARIGRPLLVACLILTVVAGPVPAVGAATAQTQEPTDGTATAADGTAGGSQLETAAGETDGGGGGLLESLLGLVGGVVWAILGFLDSTIGHALVGIPLGIYLGLKAIALYLERYE